jgi:hypothetical protein
MLGNNNGNIGTTVYVARKAGPYLHPVTDMVLLVEAKNDRTANNAQSESFDSLSWLGGAKRSVVELDLLKPDNALRTGLDFRHSSSKAMNVLHPDYSVEAVTWQKAASSWNEDIWQNK